MTLSQINADGELSIFELRPTIGNGSGLDKREWNALIGIVTAIVGNILISFALNIQRYAHIRLNRERDQRQKLWGHGKAKASGKLSYGSEQVRIAEHSAALNLNAPSTDEGDAAHHRRYHSNLMSDGSTSIKGSSRSSSTSESTVKQEKAEERSTENTTYLKSPYWWAGILLMTTGEAGNFLAYGFAPASIVSPLGVVALVSNCIIAPCLLKEPFRTRDLLGVITAVAGAVVVVLSAKNSETKMGPEDVWKAITRWEFEVYLGITAGLIVGLMWASGKYGARSILIDLGLVGLFGGYTALSTKGVASLLSDTLWFSLTFPITYLLLFVLVATAFLQIRYVNRALQRFDSTQVIPTQFVLFTLSVIVGSAILYRDFESATVDRVGKFAGGCVLTFLGVYFITSGRSREGDNEDEDAEDEEQMIGLLDEEAQHEDAAVDDGDEDSSRRISQVSVTFSDATAPTNQRRKSHQPLNRQKSTPQTPQRLDSYASSMGTWPRTPSETDPDSPLLQNPWASSEQLNARRPLPSAVSSPVLPTTAQGNRPFALRGHSQQLDPPRAERPLTLTRNSISRMMPGPLISPLSSSLSAIVADNLRRGLDSPTRPRRRRGLSGLRESRSPRHAGGMASEETPLRQPDQKDGSDGSEALQRSPVGRKGRSQSVSFGDFFRFTKGSGGGGPSNSTAEGSSASGGVDPA
ncbi:hypothetical protein MMC13_008421 [Lambiella insularis]|nr:hypothetical protein [Lambiella insularis]